MNVYPEYPDEGLLDYSPGTQSSLRATIGEKDERKRRNVERQRDRDGTGV